MAQDILTRLTAKDLTKTAFNSVRSNAEKTTNVLRGLAAGFAALGVGAFIKESLVAADQINKVSDRLGVSTEALSEYKHVAELTGVSFKNITDGFQKMARRVDEAAHGTGIAKDALAELGLSAERLTRLELDQQFEIIAESIAGLDSETRKVTLAQKLFDSENVKLLQTMVGGASKIREMREEARALGLTLSDDAADGASDALDAWVSLSAGTKALGITIVGALGPAIGDVIDWFGKSIPSVVETTSKAFTKLQGFIQKTGSFVTKALSQDSARLAAAADFIGLETLAKALRNVSEDYDKTSDIMAAAALRLERSAESGDAARLKGLQAGLTFQEAYTKARLEGGEIADQIAEKAKARRSESEKAEERRLNGIDAYIERLETERDTLGLATDDLIAYQLAKQGASADTIQLAQDLQEEIDAFAAITAVEEENEQIMARSGELATRTAKESTSAWTDTGKSIQSAFANAVTSADSFDDALKGLLASALEIAQSALFQQLGGAGAGGGGFGGLLGSLFGGGGGGSFLGFANGGRTPAGMPFMVGERGPEVMSMGSAGNVSPVLRVKVDVSGDSSSMGGAQSRNQLAAAIGDRISRGLARNR